MNRYLAFIFLLCLVLASCKKGADINGDTQNSAVGIAMLDSLGWRWQKECPEDLSSATFTTETDTAIRLEFYGWQEETDRRFQLTMPTEGNFRRVLMEYTMTAWGEGCSDWDMVTEIWVKNQQSGEWYELQRAITPYGHYFNAGWQKRFYVDVTHLLPIFMQSHSAEFKIYYGGFDASGTRAHAVGLKFYFFEGANRYGEPTYTAKIYDSFTSGNNGYRAWAYGVDTASIEAQERLGERTVQLPAGSTNALLRVCITGHGQERLTSEEYQGHEFRGYFPNRPDQTALNPAEFDPNWYTIKINGKAYSERGYIWENNEQNYSQAGSQELNRAGWGPGKPANAHYWWLTNIPADGRLTIDLDLDEYISNCTSPNAAYVANYYVMADIFAFK